MMQSDSVYEAELADNCDFSFKQPRDPDPYHIMVEMEKGNSQKGKHSMAR